MISHRDLSEFSFFSGIPEDVLPKLADLFVETQFERGAVIVRTGDPGSALYLIVSGSCGIWNRNRDVQYALMHPGDIFGEMSIITGEPVSATVVAGETSRLFKLSRDYFDDFIKTNPDIAYHFTKVLALRMKESNKKLVLRTRELIEFNSTLEEKVRERTDELKRTQAQLAYASKMASIGELSAGIAHQTNNPLAIIDSSHDSVTRLFPEYRFKLEELTQSTLEQDEKGLVYELGNKVYAYFFSNTSMTPTELRKASDQTGAVLKQYDRIKLKRRLIKDIAGLSLDKSDLERLLQWLSRGNRFILGFLLINKEIAAHFKRIDTAKNRIQENIAALKTYSHLDQDFAADVDIHHGIEATLQLMQYNFKEGIEIEKEYGKLPGIECHPDQLNQVWQNLLANAAQSMNYYGVNIRSEI